MSEPIGVGDWVECLKSSLNGVVVAREVYCVEAMPNTYVGVFCRQCGNGRNENDRTLNLRGVPNDEAGWCPCRFKPIYRPSESLFLTRLMDVPADPEQVTA